jgi:hypothetical protein
VGPRADLDTVTFVMLFAEERSVRGPAVHFSKLQRKCRLSHIMGRCVVQSVGPHMIPLHTYTKKRCWKLLSTVWCGLL